MAIIAKAESHGKSKNVVTRKKVEGKSSNGHTGFNENFLEGKFPSLCRHFFQLPFASSGQEVKENFPYGTAKNKLSSFNPTLFYPKKVLAIHTFSFMLLLFKG